MTLRQNFNLGILNTKGLLSNLQNIQTPRRYTEQKVSQNPHAAKEKIFKNHFVLAPREQSPYQPRHG
jgi:hypothetical protein